MKRILFCMAFIASSNMMIYSQQNITSLRWQNVDGEITEAHVDDCVTLYARMENIENGEEVTVSVWVKGEETDDLLNEYTARVYNNQIVFYWIVRYDKTIKSCYDEWAKKGFVVPQYYFTVQHGTKRSSASNLLTVKAWLTVWLTFGSIEPAVNQKYELILPDNTRRQGWTDADGCIREFDLPIGEISYYLQESDEQHEVKPGLKQPDCPLFYRVRENDNLWKIAGYDYIYGNPHVWKKLYKANKNNFIDADNPNLIEIDQVLIIPSLENEIRGGMRISGNKAVKKPYQ